MAVICCVQVDRGGKCRLTSGVQLRQVVERAAGGVTGLDQVASQQRDGSYILLPGGVFLWRVGGS